MNRPDRTIAIPLKAIPQDFVGLPGHRTVREEWANVIVHAIGLGLVLVAGSVLAYQAGAAHGWSHSLPGIVYAVSLAGVFAASTLFHSSTVTSQTGARQYGLLVLDHATIYLHMGGIATPILWLNPAGPQTELLGAVWIIALLGVWFQLRFTERRPALASALHLVAGWLVVLALWPTLAETEREVVVLLIAGGATITFGAIFYAWRSLAYSHAIWHALVVVGCGMNFYAVYQHLLG